MKHKKNEGLFNSAFVQARELNSKRDQEAKALFWGVIVELENKFYESKSKRERAKLIDEMQEREEAILERLRNIKEAQVSPYDSERKKMLSDEYAGTYRMWDKLTTKRQGMEDNFSDFEAKAPKETEDNLFVAPVIKTPVQEAPAAEAPTQEEVSVETPVQETPAEEASAEEAPVIEAPVQDTSVETPTEETPVTDTPVVEAPTQEETVEAPVDETPVAEAPVTETPTEKAAEEPKVNVKDLYYNQPTLTIPDAGETFAKVYVDREPQKAKKDNFAKVGCGILGVLLIAGAVMAAYHFKPFNNEKTNNRAAENKDTIQQVVNNEETAVVEPAPVEEIATPKVEAKEEDVVVIESKDVIIQKAETQTNDNAPKATSVKEDNTPKAVPVISAEEAAALEAEAKKAEAEKAKAEAVVEPAPVEEVMPEVIADEKAEEAVAEPAQTTINVQNGIFGDVSIVNNYTTNNNGNTVVIGADERGVMISPDGMVVVPGKAKEEVVEETQPAPVEAEQVNDEEEAEYFRIENERSSRHVTSKGDVVEQSSYRVVREDGRIFNVSESRRNGEVTSRIIRERKVRQR